MTKLIISSTLTLLAVAAASSLQAQVLVNGNVTGFHASYTWDIGKDALGDTSVTNQGKYVGGSFTGGVANDSFTVTVTAANDWDATLAEAAVVGSTFDTYVTGLTGLTGQDVSGLGEANINFGAFGVRGGPLNSNIDAVGEVVIFSFGNFNLNPLTSISLTTVNFGLGGGTDRMDYVYYDASEGTVIQSSFNDTLGIGGPYLNVGEGDRLVIAFSSNFIDPTEFSIFRVQDVGFDLVTIPEPSSAAFLGFVAGALCLLRRRK